MSTTAVRTTETLSSTQDDWVNENLKILRDMQLESLDWNDYREWKDKVDAMSAEYAKARAREKDDKRAKEVADAIAKAVPAITKSVIAAVNAFKKGDAINGSAEIMDICASLAPLISTFLSAAGPEGALIGALFSIVGQILRCFGPKQESDVSKLEKFLNELKAQTELEDIKAVHDAVLTYAMTLLLEAQALQKLLAQPLATHEDYKAFMIGLVESDIVLDDSSPHASVAMFEQWKVLEYLQSPENQDVALWPAVLGICCKTYSDLVTSTMTITAMANTDDMLARLRDVAPDGPARLVPPHQTPLYPQDKHDLEKKLLKIIAYARARKLEYESCNARMLKALKGLTGPARQWGLHGCIAKNYALKFTSGPKRVKTGDWNDVSDRNFYHQLTLIPDAASVISQGQQASQYNFKPAYHCFVLKSTGSGYPGSNHWVDHMWVHADTLNTDNYRDVLNNFAPAFTDIWVAGETDKGLEVMAGTGAVAGAPGSVTAWGLNPKDSYNNGLNLERVDWWPQTKAAVSSIRTVDRPTSLLDDPDQAGIPITGTGRILYASMSGSTELYVNTANQDHYIPGPAGWGPANGINVDDSYLWLYQPYGFAVVTHASVLQFLAGKQTAPRWIQFDRLPDELLGEHLDWGGDRPQDPLTYQGAPVTAKPATLGLISLSPCEDGTLLAAVVHRTIVRTPVPGQYTEYDITDEWRIHTTTYGIDVEKGTVTLDTWKQIPGDARHVQKLPMPGWTLLSSLMTKLTPAKP